ncbi:hypothetical protein AB7M37_004727 [Sinorhizobium fredii]
MGEMKMAKSPKDLNDLFHETLGRIDIHASQIIVAASKAKPSKWIVRRS